MFCEPLGRSYFSSTKETRALVAIAKKLPQALHWIQINVLLAFMKSPTETLAIWLLAALLCIAIGSAHHLDSDDEAAVEARAKSLGQFVDADGSAK